MHRVSRNIAIIPTRILTMRIKRIFVEGNRQIFKYAQCQMHRYNVGILYDEVRVMHSLYYILDLCMRGFFFISCVRGE